MSGHNRKSPPSQRRPRPTPRAPRPGQSDDLRRAARMVAHDRRCAEERAKIAALPVQHAHAAGIDAGDASHWVCVSAWLSLTCAKSFDRHVYCSTLTLDRLPHTIC